jgi:hypothetical protein
VCKHEKYGRNKGVLVGCRVQHLYNLDICNNYRKWVQQGSMITIAEKQLQDAKW